MVGVGLVTLCIHGLLACVTLGCQVQLAIISCESVNRTHSADGHAVIYDSSAVECNGRIKPEVATVYSAIDAMHDHICIACPWKQLGESIHSPLQSSGTCSHLDP